MDSTTNNNKTKMTNEEKRFLLQAMSNEIIQMTLNLPGLNHLDFNIMHCPKSVGWPFVPARIERHNPSEDGFHSAKCSCVPCQMSMCSRTHAHALTLTRIP